MTIKNACSSLSYKKNVEMAMAKRILLNNFDQYKYFPKYLMIEPVFACNARCVMCGIYNKQQTTNNTPC